MNNRWKYGLRQQKIVSKKRIKKNANLKHLLEKINDKNDDANQEEDGGQNQAEAAGGDLWNGFDNIRQNGEEKQTRKEVWGHMGRRQRTSMFVFVFVFV